MSQRAIAVCLVLFALVTLGFSGAAYWQVNEARKDTADAVKLAGDATQFARDATQFAERARREAQTAMTVLPRIHERIVTLEHETIALRETLLEVPGITVRVVRPLQDALAELGVAVADIRDVAKGARDEARSATTAARAAFAKSDAAYAVAAEARDVATIAYNAEAISACAKIFEALVVQRGNLNALNEDMRRIRELGRDRRALSVDYDDLFAQSLALQLAILQNTAAYNSLAEMLGDDFMKQHGLPRRVPDVTFF